MTGATYNVYRGTTSGGETSLAAVAAVTSSSTYQVYNDLTAVNGTTYFYYVKATLYGVEGSATAEVTAALPSYSGFPAFAFQFVGSASAVGSYLSDASFIGSGSSTTSASANTVNTMCFKVETASQPTGSSGVSATISYSNNGGSTDAYTSVSGACGTAVAGYDTSVTNVRWTMVGTIPATSASNSGSVGFRARVP